MRRFIQGGHKIPSGRYSLKPIDNGLWHNNTKSRSSNFSHRSIRREHNHCAYRWSMQVQNFRRDNSTHRYGHPRVEEQYKQPQNIREFLSKQSAKSFFQAIARVVGQRHSNYSIDQHGLLVLRSIISKLSQRVMSQSLPRGNLKLSHQPHITEHPELRLKYDTFRREFYCFCMATTSITQ